MTDSDPAGTENVHVLLREYEQSARDWAAASSDARKANVLFEANHALYQQLRNIPEGRIGIATLIAESNPGVRLLAATHSLSWQEFEAVAALEALVRAGGLPAVTAKYTLLGHRSGSLNLDW